MSKQSEAKEKQGYTKDLSNCSRCAEFTFTTEKSSWGNHIIEKNLRCSIGSFKVNKTATCEFWRKA